MQGARDQCGVAREQKASPAPQREHPLAHRNARQHAIDQVRGSALHPSRRAGRTDSTALAGECDEQLVAAGDAAHASESVGENAAAQVSLELGHDETRQSSPSCSISARKVLRCSRTVSCSIDFSGSRGGSSKLQRRIAVALLALRSAAELPRRGPRRWRHFMKRANRGSPGRSSCSGVRE